MAAVMAAVLFAPVTGAAEEDLHTRSVLLDTAADALAVAGSVAVIP